MLFPPVLCGCIVLIIIPYGCVSFLRRTRLRRLVPAPHGLPRETVIVSTLFIYTNHSTTEADQTQEIRRNVGKDVKQRHTHTHVKKQDKREGYTKYRRCKVGHTLGCTTPWPGAGA